MKISLYIKTHNKTGLKYFGKTIQNPFKYNGSGKYWKSHLKKHGLDINTVILGEFNNMDECTKVALQFSKDNNIVKSKEWANLIEENGKDGAPVYHPGHIFTPQEIEKMSISSKERWKNDEYREKLIKSHKERWTEELREKQSNRLRGVKRPEHSKAMTGRTFTEETKNKMRKPKHKDHGKRVSAGLKGKPKSEEHKEKLRKPKRRLCRLIDRKEMSINYYTRWLNKLITSQEVDI